jgi:hypothetical protein
MQEKKLPVITNQVLLPAFGRNDGALTQNALGSAVDPMIDGVDYNL